jgi:hypothetical protein
MRLGDASTRGLVPLVLRDWLRAPRRTTRYLVWRAAHLRPPRLEAPIFIVGCPRSGTSLMADLFATHPDVANWSEAGRLWDPIDYSNPEADHCWGAERVRPREARRLHGWCEWYRRSQRKRRFLNKHPRNSVRIDYLDRILPDARFVHVIRDGRAVVASMLAQIRARPRRQTLPFGGFCKPPGWRALLRDDRVEQTALQWREIVRHVRERGGRLAPRYVEVRYEDACEQPAQAFRTLFAFAGLPYGEPELAAIPERLENRNARFRDVLSESEIATVERVAAELLAQLGYARQSGRAAG